MTLREYLDDLLLVRRPDLLKPMRDVDSGKLFVAQAPIVAILLSEAPPEVQRELIAVTTGRNIPLHKFLN